jgi:hypothetical protein
MAENTKSDRNSALENDFIFSEHSKDKRQESQGFNAGDADNKEELFLQNIFLKQGDNEQVLDSSTDIVADETSVAPVFQSQSETLDSDSLKATDESKIPSGASVADDFEGETT